MKKKRQLDQKNVLITGAAGGLGQELCLAFGNEGSKIIAIDIDFSKLQSLQSLLQEHNISCDIYVCDITDKEQCQNIVDKIDAEHHSLDIVIHNAGVSHRSRFIDTKLDVLEKVLAVNVNGTINLTHYTLAQIIKNKGSYVAVSSVAGFAPLMGRTGYAASKHALHGFFETLRAEVESLGVNVLLVCPSFMRTAMEHKAFGGDGNHVSNQKQTVGKVLTPRKVAEDIVRGVIQNKKRLYISPIAKMSLWLNRLAPNLYSKIMKRKMNLEFK